MASVSKAKSSRLKVREHRQRLRRQGLRPIQIWVPDVRAPRFRKEAHRQSASVYRCNLGLGGGVKRGEIWTAAGGNNYAGKPRPVVIVQDDSFDATNSITICAFTTDETEAPLFRLVVEPSARNRLRIRSRLMIDKNTTLPKSKLGTLVGRLDDKDILRLNQAMLVFLGLAISPRLTRQM
jgi:mRNA interferase MazF